MTNTTATKIHFMGTAFARSTACGKFVEGTRANDPKWTQRGADVTCDKCRAARGLV